MPVARALQSEIAVNAGRLPPMNDVMLILPDFLLIMVGAVLCKATPLNRRIWDGVEPLVYYVLFPALLFTSIVKQPQSLTSAVPIMSAGVSVVALGIVLTLAIGRIPQVDRRLHASGAQVAFRFNSFVGLALARSLAGEDGVAWMALILSVCVPLCNTAAVWPLARHAGAGFWKEVARNPLIIGTVSGLVVKASGWMPPDLAMVTLSRMGQASVILGLMTVGAGLQMGALKSNPALAGTYLSIRHLLLPAAAIAVAIFGGFSAPQQAVLVAFASLPTATSAYVLAARMGGDGPFVAGLVSLSTLGAMVGLPLSLSALRYMTAA